MSTGYAHDAGVLADGVLVVRRFPRMRHPAAHRDGIALLGQMIASAQAWDAMTDVQRRLVGDLCAPLLTVVRAEGDEVTPPLLPERVRTGTVASLRRKRLVDDERRLTTLAVLAAQHGPSLRAQRRGVRDVDTVTTTGGVL